MLFKRLNGLVLNIDNVLLYAPVTIREYFKDEAAGGQLNIDVITDKYDLFSREERLALADLVKRRPGVADTVVIAYVVEFPGHMRTVIRKDEYQQIVGNLLSKGVSVVTAKQTLPDDLKGL